MLGIEVDHEQGIYTMNSEVWFDATVEQVYEVFRYWDNSTKFSSAIVESRDVEPDAEGRPQFYVRNRGCVLFFCTSFERRGYVEAISATRAGDSKKETAARSLATASK